MQESSIPRPLPVTHQGGVALLIGNLPLNLRVGIDRIVIEEVNNNL